MHDVGHYLIQVLAGYFDAFYDQYVVGIGDIFVVEHRCKAHDSGQWPANVMRMNGGYLHQHIILLFYPEKALLFFGDILQRIHHRHDVTRGVEAEFTFYAQVFNGTIDYDAKMEAFKFLCADNAVNNILGSFLVCWVDLRNETVEAKLGAAGNTIYISGLLRQNDLVATNIPSAIADLIDLLSF